MSRLGNRIIADGPFAAGGRTPGWLWAPVASDFNELRGALMIAGKSRELWRQRALDLGYGGGPCEHPARSADDTEEKS